MLRLRLSHKVIDCQAMAGAGSHSRMLTGCAATAGDKDSHAVSPCSRARSGHPR
jgi:hypothetical protein